MLRTTDFSMDVRPLAGLLQSLAAAESESCPIARLRRSQEASKRAVERYAQKLDAIYKDVEGSPHPADWILEAVAIVRGREQAERDRLEPGLELLRHKLRARSSWKAPALKELIEESVNIGEAWIALPAALAEKLVKLAAQRSGSQRGVLRAKPVEGEVDHEALTREFMARFPKLRAALAK